MRRGGRILRTLREALNASAYGSGKLAKTVASELDWGASEFSMRVTLGGDSARHFPANDDQERLVRLMHFTGDYTYLLTLADLCGFEVRPKPEASASEIAAQLRGELADVNRKVEQLLLGMEMPGGKKR